ncbi:MAG TPA: hypothetical protein VL866_20150 [Pyrinomonadaceae bacterium]|nr:hypothetical protein [Pyrinomonadaceae bacterium]
MRSSSEGFDVAPNRFVAGTNCRRATLNDLAAQRQAEAYRTFVERFLEA